MKRFAALALNVLVVLAAAGARADLTIEITQGVDNPTTVAVVPFAFQGVGASPEDMAAVVEGDLARSGQFDPLARTDMLGLPSTEGEVYYRDWRALNTEYLLIGRTSVNGGTIHVDYELFDVLRQTKISSGQGEGPISEARMVAHRIADLVYEKLTGIRGAFATRILYVEVTRSPGTESVYRLVMADSDGARPVVLLQSRQPLLSPAWSPDGRQVAYVSFETGRPAIFRQELATGQREQMTNFQGLNSSPAWSPDGRTMAMVLSKDGSPDIYLMDLATRQLTRIVNHYAIDTEPAWMPDGKSLLFTSDRGGKPQIYRYSLANGATERVTYEGSYNARARVAQDGRNVVLVHQQSGSFNIAVLDLVTKRQVTLTSTQLDESPSIAPNGSMVLYATKSGDRGILAGVSVDGGVKFRLPSRAGDVREPAWSPFMGP